MLCINTDTQKESTTAKIVLYIFEFDVLSALSICGRGDEDFFLGVGWFSVSFSFDTAKIYVLVCMLSFEKNTNLE